MAQPVVELETVEDAGPVVEAEHVVGQEVAVAISDVPLGDPPLEQARPAVEVALSQPLHRVGHAHGQERTDEGAEPGSVVHPELPEGVGGGGVVDLR